MEQVPVEDVLVAVQVQVEAALALEFQDEDSVVSQDLLQDAKDVLGLVEDVLEKGDLELEDHPKDSVVIHVLLDKQPQDEDEDGEDRVQVEPVVADLLHVGVEDHGDGGDGGCEGCDEDRGDEVLHHDDEDGDEDEELGVEKDEEVGGVLDALLHVQTQVGMDGLGC